MNKFKEGDWIRVLNSAKLRSLYRWRDCDVLIIKLLDEQALLAVPQGCGWSWNSPSHLGISRYRMLNDIFIQYQFDSYELTFKPDEYKISQLAGDQLINPVHYMNN